MSVATARVFNLSRGSLHDGKGIRTVVYCKGCNMTCAWCHNPEGISLQPEILLADSKCMHCGRCLAVCPMHHQNVDGRHVFLREGCMACGRCAQICPTGALELCGQEKTPQDILREINKDRHFYKTSSGGVTFSGGECLLFPDFIAQTAALCHEEGILVAVESALCVAWDSVATVLPFVDDFFVDLKHMSREMHKQYTGQDNVLIHENIRKLAAVHPSMTIRIPLIPGINDDMPNLLASVSFAKECGGGITGVELLKYNILDKSKYTLLGQMYTPFAEQTQSDSDMKTLCQTLNQAIGETSFVYT